MKLTTGFNGLQNLGESSISTALIIIYLKILCWKFYEADSEEWLGSEIDNIELEDKLYEICENFIIKRFNIKDLDEEQKNVLYG